MTETNKVVYAYVRHEEEAELCALELRSMLGARASIGDGLAVVEGDSLGLPNVDRSPFFKRRLDVIAEADTLPGLLEMLPGIELEGRSFKVLYTQGQGEHKVSSYGEQRELERLAGSKLRGTADMRNPDRLFGLMSYRGRWLFGTCAEGGKLWLKHQSKPQNYSTALPTRAARAIVNIAAGEANPPAFSMIDPCCGMGTVLIEALSMGFPIKGIDRNPMAARGARVNLAHFGYPDVVRLGDMREETGEYDAAIVDLPYNLCSVLPEEEASRMLLAVRRMAARAVIVATEEMDGLLSKAAFRVKDRARLSKGSFTRYISVVE
ncbi:TRM11 family SAM-dependent methyltransferase [Paenibacillus soyae]|uniref:RNA methyltransferase n=1 Tax=Paenibacillus soyae TaxID=2969249 RepID=A0A9X2MNC4_9BACL|nr:RNA methyltransferase [Paenibacillus soyae]MCR2803470.1 RNA methyltransferase [Paenibacillus soyae]